MKNANFVFIHCNNIIPFLMRVNTFFLTATLCLSSSLVPVCAAPKTALPPAVRVFLPKGATSFLCERLPIGPNGTKMLVHIWGAMRANTADSDNSYQEFSSSPLCVDVFEPRLDERKQWGWHLVSSAAYLDETRPTNIVTHWLVPAKKQGAVLEILSGTGAPGLSTYHTLLVWENPFEAGSLSPTPQRFSSGASGGGSVYQTFGVDGSGQLTITAVNAYGGKILSSDVLRWNGERFASLGK